MQHEQVAGYLNQTITDALEAQNLRFREHWEPLVVAALSALERVVEKSYRGFMQRVGAELEQAATGEPDWERLEVATERLAASWGSRLTTIARTLTHAGATRLRLAQA